MIAILTDFGNSEYLGVVKGVIHSTNPKAKIVDLFNHVSPHNVKEGAWILLQNYKYFPKKSIFLCVVDPGVGSERKCVAIKTKNYYFIGPDNGLMFPAANKDGIISVVKLSTKGASKTFHGRDVFAKAAAHLDKDISIEDLGEGIELKEELEFHLSGREGEVVRIDNFGNIITNLKHINKKEYDVKTSIQSRTMNFYKTYGSAPEGELFLIEGSCKTLEISLKNEKAIKKFPINVGDKIELS